MTEYVYILCAKHLLEEKDCFFARAAHADAPHNSTKDVTSVLFSFCCSICQKMCPLIVCVRIGTDEPKDGWVERLEQKYSKRPNLPELAKV